MLPESEYEIVETLYESDNSTIYRAKHQSSGNDVVVKQGKNTTKAGLYNEYNLIREQNSDNSIVELTQLKKMPALMRQFYSGKSLRQQLENNNSGLDFFFTYCFKIIDELQKIHTLEIIHKDLSPDNILINEAENKVHIIDFELSTRQQFQQVNYKGASVIEGTLQYISPEQTGRMNRVIDYRSDFYSLGVIFYEMLTGKKPFDNKDALELIHCHIALLPPSIQSINPVVPDLVAAVVNKLMAKNAEERYQSLSGLKVDLQRCYNEWKKSGTIAEFQLGKGDLPIRLNVSQKLVGREHEIAKLFSLFEEAASGKKVLLELKGLSGLGKTMLIRETARPLTASKGTYVSGKFDFIQRNVPYFAWTQALNQLADLLLTESEENISLCKKFLSENMQGLESDILAIAPKWKAVFGETDILPLLNPKEQQSRVQFAVSLFLKSVMKITKPLLFFIDDWQWADEVSIELLRSITRDVKLRKLFLAMAYRNNETDSTHPFIRVLNDIKASQSETHADTNLLVEEIELKPLTVANTNEILSETFSCSTDEAKDLGELIHSKTQGNPFIKNQLLEYLYTKKHIWLDTKDYAWKWNIDDIRKLAVTENIANVIIEKINHISTQSLEILTFASCLGNDFSMASLHFITQMPEQKLHSLLWEAIKENIIEPLEKDYKFVPEYYEENKTNIKFKFTHDRIQQALYNRTESKLREELHFKAAEFELAVPGETENIFITANHLVSSGGLLLKSNNKNAAAKILLEAGKRAFSSAAYESSFIFLSLFEEISEGKITTTDYCLLIQSAYLNNLDVKASEYCDKAFNQVSAVMERSLIYEAMLKGTIAMNKLNEAVAIARKAFAELGFKLPPTTATKGQIIWSAIKTQIAFPDKKIKEIETFPKMTDEVGIALMRIFFYSLAAFFFVERDTYPLVIFKMVRLSKKSGNTPESIIGYGSYGLILAGVMNKPEAGYNAGKEAMKLFDTFDAPHLLASAGFVDTSFIAHWKEPLVSFEKECLNYYEKGLNTGNLEYASWNLYTHSSSVFFRGDKISALTELFTNYEKFYLNHRQLNAQCTSYVIKNTLYKMLASDTVSLLDTEEEQQLFEKEQKAKNSVFVFVYNFMKLFLGAFHHQPAEVLKYAYQNQKDIENSASLYWQPFFRGFKTIIYINSAFEGVLDYDKIKKELQKDRKKLELANKLFEGNVGWILDLMDAEIQAYEKKVVNHSLYSRAAEKARKSEFHFPAILIELMRIQKMKYLNVEGAKQYWLDIKDRISDLELNSVIHAWETKYPDFKEHKNRNVGVSQNRGKLTSEQFDVQTIIKTTQILSGEIVLDKLVDKMMQFSMENAGARYGCLLIKKDNEYELAAEKFADEMEKEKGHHDGIPHSIFNYVHRTGEPLILDFAMDTMPYNKDPKVIAVGEKSVICVPIINQNESIGMIYLANQLSKAVFTEERIGLLKMVAGQMGVSLQNAILYENMEKLVDKRTEQLAEEMKKSDNLLLNIMPKEIASELKESGKATPKYYQSATVMFSDIIDFTKQAEKMTAVELVGELDMCFKAFDEIVAKHGIEKIKTIGDAYMCVGGIPTENDIHFINTVKAAMEIQQWMKNKFEEKSKEGKDFFRLRIGIHSGPVVAGVVGSSKFAYDIWGDTVNTAARMEQNSESGKINISNSVYELIKEQIPCVYRGEIEAKNKGMLKMYFVE